MKSLLLVGLTTIAISNMSMTTIAQTETQTPQTPTSPALPLPLLQAAPLVQATSKLLAQQSYQIESSIELMGNLPDRQLVANANLKTIIAAPNKVNTEITFVNRDRGLGQKYQIISNGTQVWIYDQATNQYSVSEYRQFIQSAAAVNVGTLANFYLRTLDRVNSNKIASRALAKLPPDRLIGYFQRFANVDLQNMTIRNEQIEDTFYSIYDINAVDNSYEVTTYVAPQSSNIDRIDLIGQKDGLDLLLIEQITSQTLPESISAETFNFVPPDNAEQVELQIAIEPF
ncbi:MAG: hypothetical protein AAFO95_14090 [Cyanobacteria bacterium J06600_6]